MALDAGSRLNFCADSKVFYRRRPRPASLRTWATTTNSPHSPHGQQVSRKIRARTVARIFVERGASYTTQMELELRAADPSAVDAVWTEFDPQKDFRPDFISQWQLFQVSSQAESKSQFFCVLIWPQTQR